MARPITKAEASAEIIRRVRRGKAKREAKLAGKAFDTSLFPPSRPDLRRLGHDQLLEIAS